MIEFVYNVVAIAESGIIPPFDILNERFLSGGKCNPFGNVDWKPFEISRDEYEQLVDEVKAVDPSGIWSYKGMAFVKLRRAEEFDKFTDSDRWRTVICREFSDEYIANLIKLNPAESEGSADSQDQETASLQAAPPKERLERVHKKPDLGRISQILFELSSNAIDRFASAHKDEKIYAFGFDLNVTYGEVLLCANTEAEFEETARRYVENWNYTDADLVDLKKNFGDWRYQGFNLDYENWDERWRPYAESIESYVLARDADEEEVSQFLAELIKSCSFVLLELEDSGILKSLNQEPGFYIQCIDHDEGNDEALERLERYRRELCIEYREDLIKTRNQPL
ncbi:MAG: DUF4303 domain-containing protein [Gammaproteobacteria bacterium]|nr:DUF4303 domain-containing protein [Gammaproteobacteria bacterium]